MENKVFSALFTASSSHVSSLRKPQNSKACCAFRVLHQSPPQFKHLIKKSLPELSQFFPTLLRLLWTETHMHTPPRKHTHQHLVLFQQGTKIAFKFIITQVLYALIPHIHLSPSATVGEPLRSADVSALPTG